MGDAGGELADRLEPLRDASLEIEPLPLALERHPVGHVAGGDEHRADRRVIDEPDERRLERVPGAVLVAQPMVDRELALAGVGGGGGERRAERGEVVGVEQLAGIDADQLVRGVSRASARSRG